MASSLGNERRVLRALAAAAWIALAAGCAALEEGAPLRPVALDGLLDRPAQLIVLHSPTPLDRYPDTVSAVLVHLEGQDLRLRTGSLRADPPARGTLRGYLAKVGLAYQYSLHEARGRNGRTLGYILVRDRGLRTLYLAADETLFADAQFVEQF